MSFYDKEQGLLTFSQTCFFYLFNECSYVRRNVLSNLQGNKEHSVTSKRN